MAASSDALAFAQQFNSQQTAFGGSGGAVHYGSYAHITQPAYGQQSYGGQPSYGQHPSYGQPSYGQHPSYPQQPAYAPTTYTQPTTQPAPTPAPQSLGGQSPGGLPTAQSMVAYPSASNSALAGPSDHSVQIKNIQVTGGKLANSGMLDKADPYAYFYIKTPSGGGVKGQTTTKKNDKQPNWVGEVVNLQNLGHNPESLSMDVTIYDSDLGKDDKLGSFSVPLNRLQQQGHIRQKIDDNTLAADVFLEFDYVSSWGTASASPAAAAPTGSLSGVNSNCVMELRNIKVTEGKLAKKGLDKSDPYVYFYIDLPGMFHHVKGQTTYKKNDLQPDWAGEVVKLDKFDNPQSLSLEVTVYDKDIFKDDKLGSFKKELGPLYSRGHIREKVDNNLFAADVFLEFDYTTTWGPEPPKPKSSKKSSKKKKKKGGCC